MTAPNGGQERPVWDFSGAAAPPLLLVCMMGWLWSLVLAGEFYFFRVKYTPWDKVHNEKDFKSPRNCGYKTWGPIYLDVLGCFLTLGTAGVSLKAFPLLFPSLKEF